MSTPEQPGDAPDSSAADPVAVSNRFTLKALVEACLVLEEGVATLREIDFGVMAGAGLIPPPFARADAAGLDHVLGELEHAQALHGDRFEPPRILRRLVSQGRLGRDSGQGFFPYPRPDPDFRQGDAVKLETRVLGTRGARDRLAIAWLDRPPANSLAPEVIEELARIWAHVEHTPEIGVLVIASANPQLFCAGADIRAFTQMDAGGARQMVDAAHDLLRRFERSSVVTIAAVNAGAFGGGCELAMGCDLRLAARSAVFAQPEINLGIMPGFGGTQRLPRLVGSARALEMNLTGEAISAYEAYELGLVNRIVEDHELFDTTLSWARRLSSQAPLAVEQIKKVSALADLDAGIEAEKDGFQAVFGSADAAEGVGAFLGKRAARFQGR
jgi:enoyl-CoA hydratase/3-hydroxyacyl-CoA dehydrogenase